MNVVCIMQPAYLPWMGFLDMVDQSDLFILLDTVAVNTKSWQTRNRVINSQGNETWLSIPVHAFQGELLEDVRIAEDGKWRRKHRGTLNALAKGRPELEPLLGLYEREWNYLVDFTDSVLREICRVLGISTPIVRASAYGLPRRDNAVFRIMDLCERVGATELLDTLGARAVLDLDWLPLCVNPNWIPVRWHNYQCQPYEQGNGFVPYMSVIDCLARHGPEATLEVIRAGRVSALPA